MISAHSVVIRLLTGDGIYAATLSHLDKDEQENSVLTFYGTIVLTFDL